jgi:hypothetical protein
LIFYGDNPIRVVEILGSIVILLALIFDLQNLARYRSAWQFKIKKNDYSKCDGNVATPVAEVGGFGQEALH